MSQGNEKRLLPVDAVLLRFGEVFFYATPAEATTAWTFLAGSGARRFRELRFSGIGDIGMSVPEIVTDPAAARAALASREMP